MSYLKRDLREMFNVMRIFFIAVSALLHTQLFSQGIDTTGQSTEVKTTTQNENPGLKEIDKVDKKNLIFTPGDAIEIRVFPDTTSFPNGIYPIDDRGFVYLPIIGYMKVSDKTTSTVESYLKDAYVNFLPQPNVQVRPLIRASLLGGFLEPGLYWIDPRENMWNLIERAGGTEREDGIEKSEWKRSNVTITKNLVPYIESGKSLETIGFKSGDQILVTPRPKQSFSDVFRMDILPILSVTLTAVTTAATAFIAYSTFQDRRE